ncbi:MAG: hypothetical protein WB697_05940 [Stellaceae bacterium]
MRELKTTWLYCLLAQVREGSADTIWSNAERAIPIYVKHHGMIMDLMVSVHFVAFGMIGENRETAQRNSQAAARELMAALGDDIKIVTFDGSIAHGNIGTGSRLAYTACVPDFSRMLAALVDAKYGGITELGSIS